MNLRLFDLSSICDNPVMTTLLAPEKRAFIPGTTGWSADDLLDPEIERLWDKGRYEIVEGVLTIVPPAEFASSSALFRLCTIVTRFMEDHGLKGSFGPETDYIVTPQRIARTDAVLILEADYPKLRRTSQVSKRSRRKGRIGRITVPPTLVIELISPGNEAHDRVTKRKWYQDAGVPHYWILDEINRTLECFRHDDSKFVLDVKGKGQETIRPSLFRGLSIDLSKLWL